MMIAIESEGLFRTFMRVSFVLFQRVCSVSQDVFMLSFFDKLLRCYWQCLGRERQECGAFGGGWGKIGFFIEFNRFIILHMGGKRSTIRVSTLKEMK